ncbi:MAG: hypothetical protein ACI8QC_003523 [Planctomycetota bacterium]|jgi:hypothetical protein
MGSWLGRKATLMNPISGNSEPSMKGVTASPGQYRVVSVLKMEQDQAKAEGKAATKLIDAAGEVAATGTGGHVNVMA